MTKEQTKTSNETKIPRASALYHPGLGRRKTAVARVKLSVGKGHFEVNDLNIEKYFPIKRLRDSATAPLSELKISDKFDVKVRVYGGGIKAQAEAIRHGLSRALVIADGEFKKRLHSLGFLTRDSRMVERKKYGLKKARRAPQWKKR